MKLLPLKNDIATANWFLTSQRSTASLFCSSVAVAVKPSLWMLVTMCCIR